MVLAVDCVFYVSFLLMKEEYQVFIARTMYLLKFFSCQGGRNLTTSLLLRKSENLLFLAPEVQWALKVYRVCSIHVFFKCFEPRPYLVCHVTTIENV